ncbi:MAG: hypothetical protein ACLRSW_05560 [Christensenellaceae bacterium]
MGRGLFRCIGFLAGGLFLVLLDKVVPHFHSGTNEEKGILPQQAVKMLSRCHHVSGGLAVGFASARYRRRHGAAFLTAFGLALGITIQIFRKAPRWPSPLNE